MGVTAALMATVSAAPAFAANFDLGVLPEGVLVQQSNIIGKLSGPGGTNASDNVKFSVPTVYDAASGLIVNSKTTVFGKITGLIDATAKFYTGSSANPANYIGEINVSQGVTGALDLPGLTAGNYFITITGHAFDPSIGGQYALSLFALSPAASAPGPAGFLVVGAGAAAMAFRRRRQKAAAAAMA